MITHLRTGAVLLLAMTLLNGVAYPLAITFAANLLFPHQATGSLVEGPGGEVVGSLLVGQAWTSERYFHGRPSAAGYDGAASAGSNLGPSNPALHAAVAEREGILRAENAAPIPPDLLTTSASGLDPHVTLEAAYWQVPRVARARGLPEAEVRALVDAHVHRSALAMFERVGVLELNLALDAR